MYKVLIVDDEVLVRVGLKTTIDWEANGFMVVSEASNGEQGYEQYKKHIPDVIITDIKMPKKDGLWLVEKVRKENKSTIILVLTCYDEFSYARKALKFGADDYILKSEVEDEELVAVMQSVKKKIDACYKEKHIQAKDLMNINYVRRAIFIDMIKSDFRLDTDLAERCRNIEFTVIETKLAFACVSIREIPSEVPRELNLTKRTDNAVLNIFIDLFAENNTEYVFNYHTGEYVFLLSSPEISETGISRVFTSAAGLVKQYFDCTLNVVFTDIFRDFNESPAVYKDFTGKAQILFYKNEVSSFISSINSIRFSEPNVFDLKKLYNRRIIEYIGQENTELAWVLVNEAGCRFEQNSVNPNIVRIFFSSLIGDIFSSYGFFLEECSMFQNYDYYYYKVESSDCLNEIIDLLVDFIGRVIDRIKNMRCINSKLLINRAINYINYNYDSKISLKDVAKELHLSKQYLCSTFKKETGENMSLYINRLRIEKAKKMLLEPDNSIKEIFEEVGYSNQQYFSKVFKRITGMTIMDYRKAKYSNEE